MLFVSSQGSKGYADLIVDCISLEKMTWLKLFCCFCCWYIYMHSLLFHIIIFSIFYVCVCGEQRRENKGIARRVEALEREDQRSVIWETIRWRLRESVNRIAGMTIDITRYMYLFTFTIYFLPQTQTPKKVCTFLSWKNAISSAFTTWTISIRTRRTSRTPFSRPYLNVMPTR